MTDNSNPNGDGDSLPGAGGIAVNLSLISHTNAGKTTLARTLLGRDVGEVRDAAHVTDIASGYVLVQSGADSLMLWDTPGFGDTARLLNRLRQNDNPIGWMVTQTWDRWRERPLWSSQQAVRNALEQADVILYLVNAAEEPAAAAYVALEMDVLEWIGKPVLLLLNQMGPPHANAAEEVAIWQRHLGDRDIVMGALPLDAFSRCWVQEGTLLEKIAPLLPPQKQAAMAGLKSAWEEINVTRFHASMTVLAAALCTAANDREEVPSGNWRNALRNRRGQSGAARDAMVKLAEKLAASTRVSTDELIALHGLSGKASGKVLDRITDDYRSDRKAPEGAAAVLGGLASGAATGLAADLAAGGLTLGGGMIAGGILGALGAGGIARGINIAKGEDGNTVCWSKSFFTDLVGAALLRYLSVAHFGRGRGDWEGGEHPAFWHDVIRDLVEKNRKEIGRLHGSARKLEAAELTAKLTGLLEQMGSDLLSQLYPRPRVTPPTTNS